MTRPLWQDQERLTQILQTQVPEVRLVPERHVRKVLHYMAEDGYLGPINPELPLWTTAEFLRDNDALLPEVLGLSTGPILLISEPDDRRLYRVEDEVLLKLYWRLLARARIEQWHWQYPAEIAAASAKLQETSPAFVHEAHFVLASDHVIAWDAPLHEWYPTLIALCAEIAYFEPGRMREIFPSIPDVEWILQPIAGVTNWLDFIESLRPVHAARVKIPQHAQESGTFSPERSVYPSRSDDTEWDELARRGHYVRAAIQRIRAARDPQLSHAREGNLIAAKSLIQNGLIKGLSRILEFDERETAAWNEAALILLEVAGESNWSHAHRALYDLQKMVADFQDELFAVAPVEWILSLGKKPLQRPLHRARDVILLMQFRKFQKHVRNARLSEVQQEKILSLIHHQQHAASERIRIEFEPIFLGVFQEVGLVPANLPERIARDKVIAELIDRICNQGYLRISDFRDAIARNQLKLPDLQSVGEFFRGDPLLLADRRLAKELFGVYHRGEIYLRWIQRFSAIFFGTPLGRWITLYLVIPYGGSFCVLMFLEELRHLGESLIHWLAGESETHEPAVEVVQQTPPAEIVGPPEPTPQGELMFTADPISQSITGQREHIGSWLSDWPVVLALGTLLLIVIHVPAVRRLMLELGKQALKAGRWLIWDVPVTIVSSRIFRFLWRNRVSKFLLRYFATAIIASGITVITLALLGFSQLEVIRWGGLVFGLVGVVSNTWFGRRIGDEIMESFSDMWRTVRIDLIPGIIRLVVSLFRALLGALDRLLYAVDEKLRYRSGASRPSITVKAILALIWFPIAYVVRFAFYLLVEPQVNPVKHFPVVTVSHKVIAPLFPTVASVLNVSEGTAILILAGIPGIFGFTAWELLANWRLYRANRSTNLKPVAVGHHGESGKGLLRPGFHSGTIPKLYRQLRWGWLNGLTQRPERHRRTMHELHHISEAVEALCHRELIPLLQHTGIARSVQPLSLSIALGCQHIRVELKAAQSDLPDVVLVCQNHREGIRGRIIEEGWISTLPGEEAEKVRLAIHGLLVMLGDTATHAIPWAQWTSTWSATAKE